VHQDTQLCVGGCGQTESAYRLFVNCQVFGSCGFLWDNG